ncbi:DUF4129 domain-containing protein [Streptomyces sp. SP17BM10]|uniref:DUF4129 domain-containing protein n=1 Tax=Streptomyces sp. SP17BM10 TaxID=3002530 RepID=UPI002E7774FC|nr:DUF4129 domain-containing protein [Streptomyces sp. SP17BM10]MEE1783518.1 DUF4129 domain-containing protein [Streptomyces sp. SP17BM10]
MDGGTPLTGRRRSRRVRGDTRLTGVLLVAVGLLTAAAALRPDGGLLGTATAGPVSVVGFVVLLGIGWAVLIGRFAVRFREEVRSLIGPTPRAERLREAAMLLLPLAALGVPALMLVLNSRTGGRQGFEAPGPLPWPTPAATPTRPPAKHVDDGALMLLPAALFAVLGFAVAVALVAVIVLLLRQRLRLRRREAPVLLPAAPPPSPEDVLAEAVVSARTALTGDDARAAVIACFVAMEGSLAAAGVTRRDSDSPTELVERALSHRSIDPGRAHALTALYREARYSTHPMDEGHVRRARAALDAIAAVLAAAHPEGTPAPTPAGATGPAGPTGLRR